MQRKTKIYLCFNRRVSKSIKVDRSQSFNC